MVFLKKQTPFQKEWRKLRQQEQKLYQKRKMKKDSLLNKKLEEKIPPKLQETLDAAFAKAFVLIFQKGTGIIEKTCRPQKLVKDYQVRQFATEVKQTSKSLRAFTGKARSTGTKNLLLSGASGIGMGILGIGLPDIPVFTAMILKNIYEISMNYGFGYKEEKEKYFILLIIQGALSYGESFERINRAADRFIETRQMPQDYDDKKQIEEVSGTLSKELLYMKFLQGVPVAGAVGGAFDAVYMKRISEYAALKYWHRYLEEHGSR